MRAGGCTVSYELERNEVKAYSDPAFPQWKLDAADWGQSWVLTKVFPGLARGRPRSTIKWFTGEPTKKYSGVFIKYGGDVIWVSADLATWEDIVRISAHEQTHNLGFEGEDVPTIVGEMAAKHWSGEREVFVHHGSVRYNWMPEGEKELPANAVCIEIDYGARTYVNRGTRTRPSWRQVTI